MATIIDDKSLHCIPFILSRIRAHRAAHPSNPPPFFVGINGVQGAGKTTLVSTLAATLSAPPNSLPTVVLSIDDLYLPHPAQRALAAAHPSNPLVQHRGQPSTHDVSLGERVFSALLARQTVRLPSYDKAAFAGQGDRRPESEWELVQGADVVIFEGWCVGFRALGEEALERAWREAREEATQLGEGYEGRLGRLTLEDVQFVNQALRGYDMLTDRLDALVHIDAEDTRYVYGWRQQQEAALRAQKGTGMTEEQVRHFVDGYYPAYELYSDKLRQGVFEEKDRQLRLIVGKDRKVVKVHNI